MRNRGSKLILVQLSVFTIVSLLGSALVYSTLLNSVRGETVSYRAMFSDASGLHPGDDVRMAGVKVGRVDKVVREGNRAVLDFRLLRDQPVYADVTVEVRYQNLIGQRYLALVDPPGEAPALEDRATIPLEQTRPPVNLSELFNGFAPLFEALNPAEVNELSGHLIKAVQGSGPDLYALLHQTAKVTRGLASRDEVIGEVVTNLAEVLDRLSSRGEEFDALVVQVRKLVAGFQASSDVLFDTMETAQRVSVRANGLLADLAPLLPRVVSRFNGVARTYLNAAPEVVATLEALPLFLGSLAKVTQYGSWINLYACTAEMRLPGVPVNVVPPPVPDRSSEVCR